MMTVIGALCIFLKIKESKVNKFITFCLSFSIAIMIGLSVTELIPRSIFNIIYYYGSSKGQIIIFLPIIFGYLIINILTKKTNKEPTNDLYKLGILNLIVILVHNLPEGIAVFTSSYENIELGIKLMIAISLHNLPEGIIIAVPIYYATKSRKKAMVFAFISGLAEPIGALIAYIFLKDLMFNSFIDITLLFVGVIMVTLSIKELFPKAQSYNENKYLNYGFLIGTITLLLSFLF